jgi:probable rRNA maturation factor
MNKTYCEKTHINIQNLTKIKVNKRLVKRISKKVLKEEKRQGDISIVFVNAERIQELNKRYRKEDRGTDVLCFSQDSIISEFFNLPKKYFELGEIIVCLTKVKENAEEFGSDFEKELKWVIIHGILHILGYEHEKSEKQAERMREKEKYYLKNL